MIALGSDHVGKPLKDAVRAYLEEKGVVCRDYGWEGDESVPKDYPIYALRAANAVADATCEKGLLFCGTGIGISIAANKVRGIRCAVGSDVYSALMSREHNDANMLAFGARVQGLEPVKLIVDAWLAGVFQGGLHAERLAMIQSIEETGAL